MESSLRDHHRAGSSLTLSSPGGATDEMVVALSHYHSSSGSLPSREELLRALTAAVEGIRGQEKGAIPMDVEDRGDDELDRPSSARLSDAGTAHWVLRCRLVNNAVSVLDQLTASSPFRHRSSSGASGRSATIMPCTPNSTIGSHRQRWESSGATSKEGDAGWTLSSMDDGSKDKEEEVRRLREENAMLRHRLGEVEGNWRKAVDSAKGYQETQQRLFQDLVLLREKYDDAKAHIAEVLWSYLPAESRFCPSIPPLAQDLVESEERVGDWLLGEKLGEGQFAKVFACRKRDGKDRRDFALKVINKGKISSLAALKRVDGEVGTQRTLRHRGILQVKEVLNGRFGLYVAMEMGGKDLFDFVEELQQQQQQQQQQQSAQQQNSSTKDDPLSPSATTSSGVVISEANRRVLLRRLVDAVAFCHAQGICHRDLKPENILLASPRGQPVADPDDPALFEAKLCDFGLCSAFHPTEPLTDFCGSPGFFAPEMLSQSYDGPAADIWSLGCILLELSVGHDLFCEEWMVAYDYELMQDPPTFQARLHECRAAIERVMRGSLQLNPTLVDFILGLLAIDPTQRLTIPQIVAHPWIALEDGQSFLTGAVAPSPREEQEEETEGQRERAETPLPTQPALPTRTAGKRPGPLFSLKSAANPPIIPLEEAVEEEEAQQEEEGSSSSSSSSTHHRHRIDVDADDTMRTFLPTKPSKDKATTKPKVRASLSDKVRSKLEPKAQFLQLPPEEPATPVVTDMPMHMGLLPSILDASASAEGKQQQGQGQEEQGSQSAAHRGPPPGC